MGANGLIDIMTSRGHIEYAGEDVSLSDHALQSAYQARLLGYDKRVVFASLVHDIGHLLVSGNNKTHEDAGFQYLIGHGKDIATAFMVRDHTKAKILLAKNPKYCDELSDASKASLKLQTRRFSDENLMDFMDSAHYSDTIRLRICDDKAKVKGLIVDGWDYYAGLIDEFMK